MNVPLFIHQIWYQGTSELNEVQLERIKKWKAMNPNFGYKCWSADEMVSFLSECDAKLLQTFKSFKYMHQRIDFFKYCLLYYAGGCYIDMDVTPLKPLSAIFTRFPRSHVIVSDAAANKVEKLMLIGKSELINNGVIFAKPHSPVMLAVIEEILKQSSVACALRSKYGCIQKTTGPQMFTKVCLRYKGTPDLTVIESKYMEPCFGLDKYCHPTQESVMNHQHEQTWLPRIFQPLAGLYFYLKHQKAIVLFIGLVMLYRYLMRKK